MSQDHHRHAVGRHAHKVKATAAEALDVLDDGAVIAVAGFGLCGNPEALIAGVVDAGKRNLTLVSNNAGSLGKGLATWLREGLVSKVICTYLGTNEDLHERMASGEVAVEVIPQGTFVERLRAAGAGISAFYTPTGVGTVVAEGKEERTLGGRRFLLEHALPVDVALIRCRRADPFGNVRFWRTARNFAEAMAMSARTTIAETDELVGLGSIDPDDVHLPGIFVHRVLEVREHEDLIEYRTTRPRPA